mgnify:CR=1 FL=1
MDWGNELAESGRKAEAEFPDEKEQNVVTEQTEDELDSIDTQFARERLENGEADRKTEEMLSQVLTGEWEPLTPSAEENKTVQEINVAAPDKSNAVNFHISDDRFGRRLSKKRNYQRNVAAIRSVGADRGRKPLCYTAGTADFIPVLSAGVVLPMRLTRANQTGQQNITS